MPMLLPSPMYPTVEENHALEEGIAHVDGDLRSVMSFDQLHDMDEFADEEAMVRS